MSDFTWPLFLFIAALHLIAGALFVASGLWALVLIHPLITIFYLALYAGMFWLVDRIGEP